MPITATTARRLLRSPLIDVLVGPHGIDRYLELIRPEITVRDARARVLDVRRQTARSVTLTLKPNSAWNGFRAGQFVRVGVEIDGVRRTRTYSPACSEHSGLLELTVTTHPEGLVSRHLQERRPTRGRPSPRPRAGHVHAPQPAPRAPRPDQWRQRHHAGAVDAPHPVRRGTRPARRIRPLRADRPRLAVPARR